MNDNSIVSQFASEFEAEIAATQKCIERIPETLFTWKPHEKSMNLGYLTLLVAEIPRWIATMINVGEIDFQNFQHPDPKTTQEMVKYFEDNMRDAREALKKLTVDQLSKSFVLKNGSQIIIDSPLVENISSTINHWVHHRGQLTVYMRLNDIAVPSIYGPSADDKGF
ncbi:MAG TPA: DinB family protein [Flavitalea sp.]|nr:DinB family protein [Flavitalea sp.]